MRCSHPWSHMTLWPRGLSRIREKPLYFYYHSAYCPAFKCRRGWFNYWFFNFLLSISNTPQDVKIKESPPANLFVPLYPRCAITSHKPPTNLKKNNNMSADTSSQELQVCDFLFDPAMSLNPQLSFLVARLAGLLLRALWPNYKIFIWEHANWMFFLKKWKTFFPTLPISSSPNLLSTPKFLPPSLRCFTCLNYMTPPPI